MARFVTHSCRPTNFVSMTSSDVVLVKNFVIVAVHYQNIMKIT